MSVLIEKLSEKVHNSWWQEKRKQGFLDWNTKVCPNCGNKLIRDNDNSIFLCDPFNVNHGGTCGKTFKTHTDAMPYKDLAENIKDYDRVTVKTVLDALEKTDYGDRLSIIGEEAEKAINACFKEMQRYEVGDGCVWQMDDGCEFAILCKIVREQKGGAESGLLRRTDDNSKTLQKQS